ncbi:LysE/ArgO family amino acid transporter [Nitrospirillum sp. BR 11164]|uniref:LysE/ArgO family amino acid transporter n=1 Tax=Nitrospirillum sp. BR 11164 TaxID=3104324 RepID=UPI002AFFA01E|nr:LysE/ArgO family amino acid transporter [Nitrospirillum sp. BR 11164]MEA1648353.1 LysE/ArgO family amino acid transporter [Nitrospirillum sp. BR 11164]
MDVSVYIAGLSMGLSLIIAIGAQNAFLLRQGLRGQHVFAVCLACALSDAILIGVGVAGFGTAAAWLPWLDPVMRYAGAAFLAWYGAKSLWSAWRSTGALTVGPQAEGPGPVKTLLACLAITWLNPHVYLDTVVLLGTISTQFDGFQASFAAGAITGSFLFFFSLGYGATKLRPIFARPAAWRLLEGVIALVMWAIAVRLVTGG